MNNKPVTKKMIVNHVKNQLRTNSAWATKAVVRIYEYQTASEQSANTTNEDNGVGFSGVDANLMSSFAKQILAGRTLSAKQMAIIHRSMPKYANQLIRLIEPAKLEKMVATINT